MSWREVGREIEKGKQDYHIGVTFATWFLKIIFVWFIIAGVLAPLSDWLLALMRPVGGPLVVIPVLLYIFLKFKK